MPRNTCTPFASVSPSTAPSLVTTLIHQPQSHFERACSSHYVPSMSSDSQRVAPDTDASSAGGDFIDGRFTRAAAPDGEIVVASPADTRDVLARYPFASSQ